METHAGQPRRFYLFTNPRTASHLFLKILALDHLTEKQSTIGGGYYFMKTNFMYNGPDITNKGISEWTPEQKNQIKDSLQAGFDAMHQQVGASDTERKPIFINEHSTFLMHPAARSNFLFDDKGGPEDLWTVQPPKTYKNGSGARASSYTSSNMTFLPDEFFQTWLPIFLIRRPAKSFPSMVRNWRVVSGKSIPLTEDTFLKANNTWSCARHMYEWFDQHLKAEQKQAQQPEIDFLKNFPIVIDADDITSGPEVISRFADIVGIDRSNLRFEWEPASQQVLNKLSEGERQYNSRLNDSSGIIKDTAAGSVDLDHEAELWRAEFGNEDGDELEKWVRAAMPDYEFLKERRLRP